MFKALLPELSSLGIDEEVDRGLVVKVVAGTPESVAA